MLCLQCDVSNGGQPSDEPDPVAPDIRCDRCGEPIEYGCANDARTGFLARLRSFGLGETPSPLFSPDWRRPAH
jgi:hypothetical protein